MFRFIAALFLSFVLGIVFHNALVSHADTSVKVRRESASGVVVRKSHTQTVVRREEIIGTVLKSAHREGKSIAWIALRDEAGEPIKTFTSQNFRITESVNGVARNVPADDITLEDRPLVSVLLRDVSGSMGERDLAYSKRALDAYISQMHPKDKTELIFFSTTVNVVQTFTSNTKQLRIALESPFTQSGTTLYGAIAFAITELQQFTEVEFKQAIVVLTDGGDSSSQESLDDVLTLASSSAIPIFTIGVGSADPVVLKKIATQSGGLYFHSTTTAVLTDIYDSLSQLLRGSYMVSFPSSAKSGDTIEVEIETSSTEDMKRVARFYNRYVVR